MTRHHIPYDEGMTTWLTTDEQRIWRQWLAANRGLEVALGAQLHAGSSLSMPDYEVLVVLSEADDERMRMTALADLMGWERSRLSHHLTRMDRRGLIERLSCPTDARGQFVHLTDLGRDRIGRAAPGHVAAVRRHVFDALTPGDQAALDAITAKIIATLSAGTPEP